MLRIILCAGLWLALTSVLPAHHTGDPGASPLNSAVLSAHLLEEGQISLGWSFNMTLYPELSAADLEKKVRAQKGLGKVQTPEQATQQSLNMGIGAADWLQVDVALTASRMENLREGHMHGDGSYGSHNFGSPAGFGNTDVRVKSRVAQGESWKLAALLGASLPTGEDNALTDGVSVDAAVNTTTNKAKASPKFAYLSPAFQPGSGATRGTLALAFTQEWGLWTLDASAMGVLPAAYKTYKAGNSLSVGLAGGHLFGVPEHERGYVGLQVAATQAEPSNVNGRGADDGGFSLSAGPLLRLPLSTRGLASLGANFLLAKPASLDPAPVAALNASIQALF